MHTSARHVSSRATPLLLFRLAIAFAFALSGCSKPHVIYFNFFNDGPPLHSVVLHYKFHGDRTLTIDQLPTGGRVTRIVPLHDPGQFFFTYINAAGASIDEPIRFIETNEEGGMIIHFDAEGHFTRGGTYLQMLKKVPDKPTYPSHNPTPQPIKKKK